MRNRQNEKELREITLFTVAKRPKKYFGVTIFKEVKTLCSKNFRY